MEQPSDPIIKPGWEGQRGGRAPHEPYHFNADEMRVLRECNRESFYQRSLPLGTLFGVGTYYAVKSGYLRPGARWGATPKIIIACVTGYFLGKFSYQQKCAEKMMAIPNSPIGEMLRRRRQQSGGSTPSFSDSLGLDNNLTLPSTGLSSGNESFAVYSDKGPSSMDLDITPRLQDSSIGDIRPEGTDVYLEEEPLPAAQNTTTYEELRRQNREDYERRRATGPPRIFPGIEDPLIRRGSSPSGSPTTSPAPSGQNQYGDTWVQ